METTPAEPRDASAADPSRGFGGRLSDSVTVALGGGTTVAALIVASVAPGAILSAALPGDSTREGVKIALQTGGLPLVGIAVKIATAIVISLFFHVSVILTLAGKDRGGPEGLAAALSAAATRMPDYVLAMANAMLRVLGGFLLLIVPGVLLSLRYLFTDYAVLVDGHRGGEALGRSKTVYLAHPGRTLGNILLFSLLALLASLAADFAMGLAMTLGGIPPAVAAVPIMLLSAGITVWRWAFMLLLYRDLAPASPAPAQASVA